MLQGIGFAITTDKRKRGRMKITIKQARRTIKQAFKKDPDFRRGYVDNIACVIMDNAKGYTRDKAKRDALADKILTHILG